MHENLQVFIETYGFLFLRFSQFRLVPSHHNRIADPLLFHRLGCMVLIREFEPVELCRIYDHR